MRRNQRKCWACRRAAATAELRFLEGDRLVKSVPVCGECWQAVGHHRPMRGAGRGIWAVVS